MLYRESWLKVKKIYLDSKVLISVLRDEIGRNFRLLSREAISFFTYSKNNNFILVLSEFFFREVKNKISVDESSVKEYFDSMKLSIEKAEFLNVDKIEAKKIKSCGLHYEDAVHVAIALRTKCDSIVTFNIKDFQKAEKLISIKEPGDFI